MTLDFRSRLLTTSLLVGAGMLASPAFAQDAPAINNECPPGVPAGTNGCNPADTPGTGSNPDTTGPVEAQSQVPSTSATGEPVRGAQDIVITGTRIPQPNLTSASPVTVLSSQEIKLQGTSRTEDLINSLPQSFAAQGSNITNGASGTSTVNLRNLGASRTVVLINGRRLMPGDNLSPFPDLNFIPNQLLKRVDVLTGGASSTYGADAVGGVVNFIMDNTFTGVRLDAQASVFMHDNRIEGPIALANSLRGFRPPSGLSINGGAADIAGVIGAAFDDGRGHVQAYATYRRQRPVTQASRDYSFCSLSARSVSQVAADPARRFACGGSATSANGTFFTNVGTFQVGGPNGNEFVPGFTPFNFAPFNFYQRPDERYTLGAFADYEISPGFKPYLEAMFMDDRSDALIAPGGAFGDSITLNCDNPLLSAQQLSIVCDPANIFDTFVDPITGNTIEQGLAIILRRNVEGGGRNTFLSHGQYRIVAGMRGDMFRGVSYDASYQYGQVRRNARQTGFFSIPKLINALDVTTDPDTGLPVCRSVLTGADPACVPFNIFSPGGVTPEALAFLETPASEIGTVQQTIAHADITVSGAEYGLKTPWAETGFGFNFGVEYRKEQSNLQTDSVSQSGQLSGGGGASPDVKGQFDVREAFAEVQLPLVERNFIDLLQVSAGYRYSNYKILDNSFNTSTYKIGAEFAPIRDIRFRASYNRAVRAPNIVELFYPQNVILAGTEDPCAGPTPAGTVAQCQAAGVPAAQFGLIRANPAPQYNGLVGGDPNLEPEKADSITAGVVIQPRFIPGLALTADYFNIKVKNLIGSQSYGSVFDQCFAGDATACSLINRDQFGTLFLSPSGFVSILNRNFEGVGLRTKGWDFSSTYTRRMGSFGTLNASFIGTLQGNTATIGSQGTGTFSPDSIPSSKFRSKARVGFTLPIGLGLSGAWRHFSGVTCEGSTECLRPANASIKAQDYFDLALTARVTNKFNMRFGANNLFDKSPPVVGGQVLTGVFGNGNTYPQIYDSLGRYLFAGVTVDF